VVAAALEDEPRDRKLHEYRARLLNVVKASYGKCTPAKMYIQGSVVDPSGLLDNDPVAQRWSKHHHSAVSPTTESWW
jgi:hypothetical protein